MSEPKQWDVFISHASEDKEAVALPLCKLLKEAGLEVWLDQEEIRLGESIPDRINQGLAQLRVGLVIASPRYFEKAWAQEELHTLLELELAGKIERIIPIWHQIDKDQILQRFPSLGHRLGTNTDKGIAQVALEILKAVDLQKYDEAHPIFLEQQRKAVCRFLEAIEEEFKYASIFHPPHKIVLQEQYIPIEVTFERRYRHKVEIVRGYAEDEKELSRVYAMKGFGEESEEEKEEIRRVQVSWQEARQQHKRLMVLADPGMGKTALLKMEALTTAQQARQWLENREKNVDEVSLPIFLKLSDLVKKPDAELVETILQQLQHRYQKTFEPIKALVRRKLEGRTCLLLLDALDETPGEQRLELAEHLNIFARHSPCPIICTSRIVGYGSGFLRDAKEVEIVPFTRKQIEQYIEIWFKNLKLDRMNRIDKIEEDKHNPVHPVNPVNIPDAKGLIRELRQKPQIHGLAQNPLLLSLLCSLYQEDQLTLPARRVEIYKQVVEYMLKKWICNRKFQPEGRILAKFRLLEELAYQFSCEGKQRFTSDDLYDKLEEYLRSDKRSTVFRDSDSAKLLEELSEDDGMIQTLGDEYIFLHRTFQEYLTASYLNRKPNGIELAKKHFWDFDWHETITLFAGLLDDPIPLLKTLTIEEKDDIFSTLLLLAGQCLTECPKIDNSLIKQIVTKIFIFWHSYSGLQFIGTRIASIIQAHRQFLEDFRRYIYDNEGQMIMGAINILGRIASQQATQMLIKALNSPNNSYIQGLILQALHEIELPEAIESLNHYLEFLRSELNSQDTNIRENAIWRLGDIGTPRAIKILQQVLNNENEHLQTIASIVLGQIGNHEAIQALSQAINHKSKDVRILAIQTLEKINNEEAFQVITQACNHKSQTIGMLAISVLSETSNNKAVKILAQTLNHHDENIRLATIDALGKIENQEAIEVLIQAFDHSDKLVKIWAILTLRLLNSPHAKNALEQAYRHKDIFVRQIAQMNLEEFDSQLIQLLKRTLLASKKEPQKIASEMLANCSEENVIDFLEKKFDNEDQDEKLKAITILRTLGTSKAVDILSKAFQDTDDIVCAGAVDALEKIALQHKEPVSQQAIKILQQSLVHENHIVRMRAVGALEKVRVIETLYILVEHPDIDIYDPINLSVARTLIIHFNKENSPLIPLYSDLLRRKLPQFRVRLDLRK